MPLRPLQDRIVVDVYEAETRTAGGLFIPDTATEKPTRARVVAVGPGVVTEDGKDKPMYIKPGDEVIFRKNAGVAVEVDGKETTMIFQDDVIAVVTPKKQTND